MDYAKGICHQSMVLQDSVMLASCNGDTKLAFWMYSTWTACAPHFSLYLFEK